MSWKALSPDLGVVPGSYDPRKHVLQADMPIPQGEYNPDRLALFSRNVLTLMDLALNLRSIQDTTATVDLRARGPVARELLEDAANDKLYIVDDQLSADGEQVLGVGQLADMSKLRPVSKAELKYAKAHNDIAIRADHVLREGSFGMRLSDLAIGMRESRAANPRADKDRRTMLIHGRSGAQHHTRAHMFDPDTEVLGERFKGKASFSLAPYAGIIQPQTLRKRPDGSFQELPWSTIEGSGLIKRFSLGLLERYSKFVVLQADSADIDEEMANFTPSDLWIAVNIYRVDDEPDSQASVYKSWYTLSARKKERLHERGADLVEVLNLRDKETQHNVFDFSRLNTKREYRAMVISPDGLTPVGILPSEREFFKEVLLESVRLEDRYRELPAEYEDFGRPLVEGLKKATPEGPRVVVIDTLPDANMLSNLYKEGVRGIVFKGMSPEEPSLASAATNETMKQLTQLGMQFIQLDLDDIWVYQAEQMVRYDRSEAYKDATIRITNYGTANEARMTHEDSMRDFLRFVIKFFGEDAKSRIVFEDGGGPGSMRCSSTEAAANGVLTSGAAIYAEIVDGKQSRKGEYDAYWMYPVADIANRQRSMDMGRSVAIIHPGGFGTFFEAITSGLSTQLLEKVPFPVFVIDEQQKLDGFKVLLKDMCAPDEQGQCLAAPWTEKIFVFCTTYEEAKEKFAEVMPNLKALWREMLGAGMTIEQFKHAAHQETANLTNRGVSGPDEFFAAQIRDFIAEIEAEQVAV